MKVKLVIVSPEVTPNEYDVTLPAKIGRGHEAKLKLVHPLVSRLHCELITDGEQVLIRDLDSLNGTFVDQQRIDEDTPLSSGATVMMGTVMFHVIYGKDADRMPPPPAKKLDKTVAADGTVRQETLAKISKGNEGVSDEKLWEERVDEPTAVVDQTDEPLDVTFDDEPSEKTPPLAKPAKPAAATQGTAPQKKPPAPAAAPRPAAAKPAGPSPASKPAPAKPAAPADDDEDEPFDVAPLDEPAGEEGEGPASKDDDLDDFFKKIM